MNHDKKIWFVVITEGSFYMCIEKKNSSISLEKKREEAAKNSLRK